MGYLCTVWGKGINGYISNPGGEYSFYSNGICCGGIGYLALALRLIWGVGDVGMVTYCGSTLRVFWFLSFFCSNILVCVSVVSSLGFYVIWPCNMSARFLSASIFLCLRVKMGSMVMGFSVRWSGMLTHGWLHRRSKSLASWCFQEIIWLCLKCVLILCYKCRLYNTGSAKFLVLCINLVPHYIPMCSFYWVFNLPRHWCMVVPKLFCWSQNFPPSLGALKYWGWVLKSWACSTRFVLALVFCTIGTLGTSCQS